MVQVKKSLNLRNCHKHRVGRLAVIDSGFADLLSNDGKREVHSVVPEDITTYIRRRICGFSRFHCIQLAYIGGLYT